jgi:hypothetical protein
MLVGMVIVMAMITKFHNKPVECVGCLPLSVVVDQVEVIPMEEEGGRMSA